MTIPGRARALAMSARVVAAFLIAAGGCSSAELSCLYNTERATGKDLMLIKEDEKVTLRTCSIPQNHNRVRLVVGGWYVSEDARLKLQVRTDNAHSWVDVCRRSGGSKDANPGKPCGNPYVPPGPVSQLTMRVVGDDYSGFCVNCNMYFAISLVVESEPVDAPPPPPSCVATAAMGRWCVPPPPTHTLTTTLHTSLPRSHPPPRVQGWNRLHGRLQDGRRRERPEGLRRRHEEAHRRRMGQERQSSPEAVVHLRR